MIKIRVVFLITLFYVVFFVDTGSSLRCYACSEHTNPNCKDHFENKAPSTDCPSDTVCIKHIQPAIKLFVSNSNQKNVTRNIIRECKPSDYCTQVKDFSDFCQTCSADLCNDSVTTAPSYLTMIFGLYSFFHYL